MTDKLLISVKEAAERLSCSMTTMYGLLDKQEVRSVYQGSRRKVVVASLEKYVKDLLPYPSEAS